MDFHALQQKLFEMDPTDPAEDKRRLMAQAQGHAPIPQQESVDYLNESANVKEGSLKMDRNYSVDDFAALAGVVVEKRQRPADQVRGSEPMPAAKPGREEHPFQDRLVGEEELDEIGIVDRSTMNPNDQITQILQQVQTLSQSLQQLQSALQQMQQQQRTSAQSQTRALSNSKQNKKQPLESIDSIKDSLYAALNKKMGN